ncbi:hypothetical protein GGR56DRAFT_692537 [Xylariaceae sp. FL0804]|nr:hypothetical protein GGR56DRAFT_692537 [Xylariaceae sp. FL0804]
MSKRDYRNVREYFSRKPNFRFEKMIASGVFGATMSVVETLPQVGGWRRLVVKRALGGEHLKLDEDCLRVEINWLRQLGGSLHIVRMLFGKDEMGDGLPGPMCILEYVPNGSIGDLIVNLSDMEETIPNRVLWAFFLCLIKACMGLAYPQQLVDGAAARPEYAFPGTAPRNIAHGDMHNGNVMIGDLEPGGAHSRIPILKLIDFGVTGEYKALNNKPGSKDNWTVRRNLWDAAMVMRSMIVETDPEYERVPEDEDQQPVLYTPKPNPPLAAGTKRSRDDDGDDDDNDDGDEPAAKKLKLSSTTATTTCSSKAAPKAAPAADVEMANAPDDPDPSSSSSSSKAPPKTAPAADVEMANAPDDPNTNPNPTPGFSSSLSSSSSSAAAAAADAPPSSSDDKTPFWTIGRGLLPSSGAGSAGGESGDDEDEDDDNMDEDKDKDTETADMPCPELDPDLRDLLLRCLAVDEARRPGLAELHATVEGAAQARGAGFYAGGPAGEAAARETDAAVAAFVRDSLFRTFVAYGSGPGLGAYPVKLEEEG